jgi:hypothetical protein
MANLLITVQDTTPILDGRTNLISNPSFEAAGFWGAGTSGTITGLSNNTQNPAYSLVGSKSASFQAAFTSGTPVGQYYAYGGNYTPLSGATYSFSVWLYVPVGSPVTSINMGIRDASTFNYLLGSGNTSVSVTPGVWTRGTVYGIVSPTNATNGIFLSISDPVANGYTGTVTWYADAAQLEYGQTATPYFDGTFPNAAWVGAANSSSSITSLPNVQLGKLYVNDLADVTQVTDTPKIEIVNLFGATDSTAVSDSPIMEIVGSISVTDTTAVTDTTNILVPILLINVTDSTAVSDSLIIEDLKGLILTDSTAVSDSVSMEIFSFINITDSTVVQDGRTNFVTNPSFEAASNWWAFGTAGSQVGITYNLQDPTFALYGTYSGSFQSNLVAGASSGQYYLRNGFFTPINGLYYTFSIYIYIPVGSPITSISLGIRDTSTFNYLSNGGSPTSLALTAGTWTRGTITLLAISISNSWFFSVVDPVANGYTGTVTWYADAGQLELATSATPYFDGSLAGGSWTGTPNQSTSISASTFVNVGTVSPMVVTDSTVVSDSVIMETTDQGLSVTDSTAVSDTPIIKILTVFSLSVTDSTAVKDSVNINLPFAIIVTDTAVVLDSRTNYITNPSFEATPTVWWDVGTAGTVTGLTYNLQDPTFALYGTYSGSFQQNWTGGINSNAQYYLFNEQFTPIVGKTYTFSAYAYIPAGSLISSVNIGIRDSNYNYLAQNRVVLTPGTWVPLFCTYTQTAQTTPVWILSVSDPQILGGGFTGNTTIYVDGTQLELSPFPTLYFDGSQPGAGWSGTPNQSTSVEAFPDVEIAEAYIIRVTDSTAVSDSVQMGGTLYISANPPFYTFNDSIAFNSPISTFNGFSQSTAIDITKVTDSVTLSIINYLSVSDSTAVSDSIRMQYKDVLAVSDTTEVSDSCVISVVLSINVTDTIKVVELFFNSASFLNSNAPQMYTTGIPWSFATNLQGAYSLLFNTSIAPPTSSWGLFNPGTTRLDFNQEATTGKFFVWFTDSTNTGQLVYKDATNNLYTDGKWHRLIVNKTATAITVYIDGVNMASLNTTLMTDGDSSPLIWNASGATMQYGETVVYNRALSASEISLISSSPSNPIPLNSLAGWWPFTEGAGTNTIADISGNGNNALINGIHTPPKSTVAGLSNVEELLFISVTDTTPVTDTPALSISVLFVNVTDSTAVSDVFFGGVGAGPKVFESIAVTDSVSMRITSVVINVTDVVFPLDQNTNLISNPNFQTQILPWAEYHNPGPNPATLTLDSSTSAFGTQSLKILTAASGNSFAGTTIVVNNLVVGGTYTLSSYAKGAVGGEDFNIYPSGPGQQDFNITTTWTRYSITFIATAATLNIYLTSSNASATFWVDAVQLEAGDAASPYFDGSIYPAYWTGTPNVSTAVLPYYGLNVQTQIVVSDSTAVTDIPFITESNPVINVTDSTAVSDSVDFLSSLEFNITDTTAVTDSVSLADFLYIDLANATIRLGFKFVNYILGTQSD